MKNLPIIFILLLIALFNGFTALHTYHYEQILQRLFIVVYSQDVDSNN